VTTVFVSRPPPCTGGNKARGVSAGSSIVETAGSVREEPEVGVKTGGYGRIVAHPISYPNVFKTDSGLDTDS
jgi:hypothetical protein